MIHWNDGVISHREKNVSASKWTLYTWQLFVSVNVFLMEKFPLVSSHKTAMFPVKEKWNTADSVLRKRSKSQRRIQSGWVSSFDSVLSLSFSASLLPLSPLSSPCCDLLWPLYSTLRNIPPIRNNLAVFGNLLQGRGGQRLQVLAISAEVTTANGGAKTK